MKAELKAAQVLYDAFIKAFRFIEDEPSEDERKSFAEFLIKCAKIEVREHLDMLKEIHGD